MGPAGPEAAAASSAGGIPEQERLRRRAPAHPRTPPRCRGRRRTRAGRVRGGAASACRVPVRGPLSRGQEAGVGRNGDRHPRPRCDAAPDEPRGKESVGRVGRLRGPAWDRGPLAAGYSRHGRLRDRVRSGDRPARTGCRPRTGRLLDRACRTRVRAGTVGRAGCSGRVRRARVRSRPGQAHGTVATLRSGDREPRA
jgi:hypothetical protein